MGRKIPDANPMDASNINTAVNVLKAGIYAAKAFKPATRIANALGKEKVDKLNPFLRLPLKFMIRKGFGPRGIRRGNRLVY